MSTTIEFCINCKYAVPVGDHCACHRHAPTPVEGDMNAVHFYVVRWPVTDMDGWCGDFEKKAP